MKGKWKKLSILMVAVVVAAALSGILAVEFVQNQSPIMLTPSHVAYQNATLNDSPNCSPADIETGLPHYPGHVWWGNSTFTEPA